MEWLEKIIIIGGAVGAVGAVVAVICKGIKFVKRVLSFIGYIKESIETLKRHSRENYMMVLKNTIMNESMPIGERITAGIEYLENAGNGEVKAFLEKRFNITKPVSEAEHDKE